MRDRAFITGWKRAVLTAVLAYALALQSLLLPASGAVHAGAGNLPQAVLCVTEGDRTPDHPAPARPHDGLCCILGCHGSGSPVGPVPVAAAPDRPSPLAVAKAAIPEAPVLPLSSTILPVGSRAPPRLG
jgi:hypothetical protein